MQRDVITEGWFDARAFLRRFDVRSREDILPEPWADSYGIEIVEAPLDGAAAQLIRLADLVQIVIPERITDNAVRRFAIIHELYHYLKRHPSPSPTMMCRPKWMRRGDEAFHLELGSNAFAGAVLLPEFLLRKRCEVSPVSLDVPWRTAKEYDGSILTSAIRFAELVSERCAAVFSKNGVVAWAACSPTRPRARRSRAGSKREPGSIAARSRGTFTRRAGSTNASSPSLRPCGSTRPRTSTSSSIRRARPSAGPCSPFVGSRAVGARLWRGLRKGLDRKSVKTSGRFFRSGGAILQCIYLVLLRFVSDSDLIEPGGRIAFAHFRGGSVPRVTANDPSRAGNLTRRGGLRRLGTRPHERSARARNIGPARAAAVG